MKPAGLEPQRAFAPTAVVASGLIAMLPFTLTFSEQTADSILFAA